MKGPISFGKYYLLERINVGGMAEVFKAKTCGVEGFERLLAVKRILPNIAEDDEFIEMFIDEAKIAVQLNHANIAQIFDLGRVGESFFIALEYVHGKDLRAIFDRGRALHEPMPISQACFIIMKVCEGLDYAHNKRDSNGREMHIVHRDVSPQNILISYEGEVKLVDFGIAKAAGKASKTRAGILKGKFGYMSPEQVRGLPLDRRSDIFSVGIVLYELLTGERLFTGESDFSTLEKVRNVEILPPSTYNPRIIGELEQIILRALAKDVEDRYQNAIDLHDDLQAYLYSAGEFYSRKELANWMKRIFSQEISEENRKLEEYQIQSNVGPGADGIMPPPLPASAIDDSNMETLYPPRFEGPGRNQPGSTDLVDSLPTPLMARGGAHHNNHHHARGKREEGLGGRSRPGLNWEEDDLETQIYEKVRPAVSVPSAVSTEALPPPQPHIVKPNRTETIEPSLPNLALPSLLNTPSTPPGDKREISELNNDEDAPLTKSKSSLTLWLIVAIIAVAFSGGAIYYSLVQGKKPGNISVDGVPNDIELYLDGKRQHLFGTPPTIHNLPPGFYILAVVKPGYERWTKTVEIKPGENVRLKPQLEPLATGSIELQTDPQEADAFLDGTRLNGRTPMRISQIMPGEHRLEVRKTNFQPWTYKFEIRPEQALQLHAKLLPAEVMLALHSEPKAEAFLIRDGQSERMGLTPLSFKLNPKYAYEILLRKKGYQDWSRPVRFSRSSTIRIDAVLEPAQATEQPKVPLKNKRAQTDHVVTTAKNNGPITERLPKTKTNHPVKANQNTRHSPKPARNVPEKNAVTPPPVKPQPPVGAGTLLINSNPWTRIIVDGKDTGLTTPQKKLPLPAGKHVITLRNSKFNIDESITVDIQPGQSTKVIKNFFTTSTP